MSQIITTSMQDVYQSMAEFAATSTEVVGLENTHETIKFLTKMISESPEVYEKLLKPESIKGIAKLIESTKGKELSAGTLFTAYAQIKKIFK